MKRFLLLLILLFPSISVAEIQYTWVVIGPNSKPIARAIVSDAQHCPTITIDHKTYPMQMRAESNDAFPIHTCEYPLPKKARNASIEGKKLTLLPKQLERIVIIGDTGCRIKGFRLQNCNQPDAWPFAKIAKHLAELEPDLVIHVGDYHYRKTACPSWKKGCEGSPWGYDWPAWEADFFKPAKPLLDNTPWIMVRGNHEECERAGAGWRRLLDPNVLSPACSNYTSPYEVRIDGQQFLIFDSSAASMFSKKEQQKIYQQQFQTIKSLTNHNVPSWILLHHPIWAYTKSNIGTAIEHTASLQTAIGNNGFPTAVKLVGSGHMHLTGWFRFDKTRPLQLIAGSSGAKLMNHPPQDFSEYVGKELQGEKIKEAFSNTEFGYLLAEREDSEWVITAHRVDGSIINEITVSAK